MSTKSHSSHKSYTIGSNKENIDPTICKASHKSEVIEETSSMSWIPTYIPWPYCVNTVIPTDSFQSGGPSQSNIL